MKLTPWYPGDVKPVRVGVYQRDYSGTTFSCHRSQYCYWNGRHWGMYGTTVSSAKRWSYAVSGWQVLPWRGVEK